MKSAVLLGFAIPFGFNKLKQACLDSIAKNNIEAGYMRPLAWLGSETMLISANKCKVHTMIAVWPSFEADRDNLKKRGINLTVSSWRKAPSSSIPYGSKSSGSYMLATMIKNQAAQNGFDDALLLDNDDYIAEATTSNFFFIKDKKLLTPEPRHILNGITRQTVIKIAEELGIRVEEGNFKIQDFKDADAAFLTGTAIEIAPVASITNDTENYVFDIVNPNLINIYNEFKKLISK